MIMNDTSGIRIGDEERDQAVSGLAEHFAAGRLNKAEYDERADQVLQARFRSDLDPLFADLPRPQPGPAQPQGLMRPETGVADKRRPALAPIMMLFPMLVVGIVITAVILHAPWMLFGMIWLFVFTGFGRRHHWHNDRAQQHQHWQHQQQLWQQQQQEWQRHRQEDRQRRDDQERHYR